MHLRVANRVHFGFFDKNGQKMLPFATFATSCDHLASRKIIVKLAYCYNDFSFL